MRNSELTKKRDRRMVEMFYQLYDVKRVRLDDVLDRLSTRVFFLSSDYIYKRIFYVPDNMRYYERLKNSKGKLPGDDARQLRLDI